MRAGAGFKPALCQRLALVERDKDPAFNPLTH